MKIKRKMIKRGTKMKKANLMVFIMFVLVFFLGIGAPLAGQKIVEAIPVDQPIKVDGILNEKVWQKNGYSDFTQSDPLDGAAPTEKTVVWVAFDKKAIYIAARLFDSRPDRIIRRLGRRDDMVDSDWLIFAVDPYYDRHTGYQFAVNPAGSIVDMTLYNDERDDPSWDGIWESAAKIDDKGWTAEMRIPFHQLRFNKKGNTVWGVNFRRAIKRKNEEVVFAWAPKEESGYVSHFATLKGLTNIKPNRYMELLPYSAGTAVFGQEEKGNPFKTGEDFSANAGVDLMVALKSNLTFNLSFNPDFGQVEVDPAVINLTDSETYYEEKRPLFIEGSNIYNFGSGGASFQSGFWRTPSFFYSRRIGRSPRGYVNTDGYVSYPKWTTILAAAKLTGKVGNDWNIGFFSALTDREYARVDLNGERQEVEVEPTSYYGVLRIQKEFNGGRQGLGFITTSVLRDFHSQNMENQLSRSAFSLAVDGWSFLNGKRSWVINSWLGGTWLSGSEQAIGNIQRSYLHYYQRPDATHVELDENATSLKGWGGRLYITKQGGHFIFNASLNAISPGFDSTDIGFQYTKDNVNGHIQAGYLSYHPGKLFRFWVVTLSASRTYDFGGNKTDDLLYLNLVGRLLNYWEANLIIHYKFDRFSNNLTRGGPLTFQPPFIDLNLTINSDNRKPLVLFLGGNYGKEENIPDNWWAVRAGLKWKPKSNISLYLEPAYSIDYGTSQWVGAVHDPLMTSTYETRYLFGNIDQKVLSCTIRANWIFTPKLSLQAYMQPFIAVGKYDGFKELARPRSYSFNTFGQGNSTISYESGMYMVDPDGTGLAPAFSFYNPDFNYKSLRGTIVLRWEYLPGSTLYAVWTQNRSDYSNLGDFNFSRDIGNLLKAKGDNIFMIKFTHRFKL